MKKETLNSTCRIISALVFPVSEGDVSITYYAGRLDYFCKEKKKLKKGIASLHLQSSKLQTIEHR